MDVYILWSKDYQTSKCRETNAWKMSKETKKCKRNTETTQLEKKQNFLIESV